MTDQRPWLWRRKSCEKATVVSDKQNLTSKFSDEEIHILLSEKAELEKDLKDMNDKLSVALFEHNAKSELAKKNAEMAQDALSGWEKAEAKASSLKEELDETLERKAAYEERTVHLEAALKECMQQLRFVRDEKEQRIHDVLSKLAKDYEEERLIFNEKLSESGRKIIELQAEITELSQIIFLREKLADELNQKLADANADLKELLTRLESTDKCNVSLKYEIQVLEKELHIRNEERDFNRRSANATHMQHLENVKKIAKLESECQRLRVLVRKRLPSPAAITRMKNEVEMFDRRPNDAKRRTISISNESNSSAESPAKNTNVLVDKLHALEEENIALKESLEKKTDALQISRTMYAQASMKLTQVEAQLEELSKTQMIIELTRGTPRKSHDLSRDDDKVSCAWSSASTLISELTEKGGCVRSPMSNARSSEMNLMDDFVEMEKLALVCVDKPIGLHKSISKLVEIIEGVDIQSPLDYGKSSKTNKKNSDVVENVVHVFQWKSSDIAAIIQRFLHVCYDLLNGKVDFGKFSHEVASALEWIINHCISLQDVSSMKDAIMKQFGRESVTEAPCLPEASTSGYQGALPLLKIQSNLKEEINQLKNEVRKLEHAKKEVEEKLDAIVDDSKSLSTQLGNTKLENEDLNTQLSVAKIHLDDACEKLLSLQADSEYKTKLTEELEARCNELHIQLKRRTAKDVGEVHSQEDKKQLQTNWDVTTASEKLAQCQETIFSLGKQLKEMSSPNETPLLKKVISSSKTHPPPTETSMSTPPEKGSSHRSSLLDKMIAEDSDEFPETKEVAYTPPPGFLTGSINPTFESEWIGQSFRELGFRPLPLVPMKKKQKNAGLLKKLLWRKRKGKRNKMLLALSAC